MRKSGSIEGVDSLAIATVMFTSGQLDELEPGTSTVQVASLVRAHLAAAKLLLGQNDASADDALAEVIAALSTPPTYVDGTPWSPSESPVP